MFRAFYEKRFGKQCIVLGKWDTASILEIQSGACIFFFLSYCWILRCSLPFDVSYTVTGVGETSWFRFLFFLV